jgi:surface protein
MSSSNPPTNPNANADPDLEEGLNESQARGPEVVNEAELSVPTPSTILGISDANSKDGINLEAFEVKQALSEKIMAPAESVTDVAETLPEGDAEGVGAEDADVISPLMRNDEATIASEAGTRFGDSSTLGVGSVGGRHSAGRGDDASTVHMPEAVLVNEEGGGAGGGAVIVATPVGPALPWHKQPRNRVLMGTVFLFVAGIITAVAVLSSGSNSDDTSGAATSVSSTENRPGLQPSTITDTTAAPTPVRDCFADREELQVAVDEYIYTDCGADQTACTTIAKKYGWPMNSWCVGNVTSLQGLFNFKEDFNEDISAWDVSRVTDFSHMFNFSSSFNQNLSAWDTSSATNFSSMFANASAFDNDISTWDTSNVLDMQALFFGARSFKGDVSRWNMSNVRNLYGTFAGAASFDGELGDWDVSEVSFVSC